MKKISIVIPCYNEEESIPYFYDEITKVSSELKNYLFEFIYIDDGSKDSTLEIIRSLNERDNRNRYISFSRNFGKEAALYAGLSAATGDYVAVMDADLQDPPALLPKMINYIENEGFDCVATRRVDRKGEPMIRSFFAKQFYKTINKMSKTEIVDGARDFRLMTRQMVESILDVSEYNRFSKGIFSWVGFETKWLEYENQERAAGETKWSFWKLFLYSIDGIISFSAAPLAIASIMGVLFCVISLLFICVIIARTLLWGDPTSGWPSLVCIIFLVSGVQLFCLGITGQYISKTYMETKNRPIYIVKEKNKFEEE